ncbi:hypothetical protein TVAG_076620 [Trichomonas vaginalis G3]|uniref:Uncharacterized protein n=1 Tax=Trichomonas vaginalis (strain ATCC PRA-98 / G3) TaxID=412133 RepID=A2D9Q9_TRIV3|nr:hypothetical protein TVAGG3_0292190 [Trichomonas vaginalis G3]EAY22915.1 hypothetical protein TVAG_076620 [Trichomonas vaginalis G3]KAI5527359.1 hypothetical protein TVAGG3_0292190 [Trichomonas vaginalis G3]|eukprot:XP_001583901.1 hypothetical protein [Trichomonas vaginalis G3]
MATRSSYQEARKNMNYITSEDVITVKNKRNLLLQQKYEIITHIARYEDSKCHKKSDAQNQRIVDSVSQQIESYKAMIQEKKDQINELVNSETAASISETQEESKIYHLELVRLKMIKGDIESEIESAQKHLAELVSDYSPRSLWIREKDLEELRNVVRKREKDVHHLEFPDEGNEILQKKKEKLEQEKKQRKELMKKIKEVRNSIKAENRKINRINKKLAKFKPKD